MEIRRISIQYASTKKRNQNYEEQTLLKDIDLLERRLQNNNGDNDHIADELELKKISLEDIYKHKAQGAYIRSRARYKIEGEKPTKMFCALEKYNGVQKYVPQLIVDKAEGETEIITEQKKIEKEIFRFYEELYTNRDDNLEYDQVEKYLEPMDLSEVPRVAERQKENMEGLLTLEEMSQYLKKNKINVSPGSTGFTNEFYKFFWRDIKHFVIRAVNYSFSKGSLGVTQKLGSISIIPKGEKDKRYIANWRPLTLLNTLYKLVSGCIADRIKPTLNKLINPDQKGFVSGRYIGEVIRSTYDTLHYAKEKMRTGLLLCIDFEKAYDCISFNYIQKCLKFFNFGDDLIKWVKILLNDFTAIINHCGNISERFQIGRGCRQGDPIASYLFILCIEILAIKMRGDSRIKGFRIGDISHLLEIYADDLTVFLEPSETNLRITINALDNFKKLSGLKISVGKTKAIWFGRNSQSDIQLCPELDLKWSKEFTLLGTDFTNDLKNMEQNFETKLRKIEKTLSSWRYRFMTPFGRVTVVKSLGLSQISHIALVIPSPKKQMVKKLESMFYKFIWDGGSEKVNRIDATLPVASGGLGMPNLAKFWSSFKFSWIRRLIISESFWPNILVGQVNDILNTNFNVTEILQLGDSQLNRLSKTLSNVFWKQVFSTIPFMIDGATFCHPDAILSAPFFDNKLVMRNNRTVRHCDFPELPNKIILISDFFVPGTVQLLDRESFCALHNCNIDQFKYIDIRYIITLAIQKLRVPTHRLIPAHRPQYPLLISTALLTTKGCGRYYQILQRRSILDNKIWKRENKWNEELERIYSLDFWRTTRRLCANITIDNRLKWLQFQINRNSLQTNVIISHFIGNVSRLCQFCHEEDELVSHLFWSCRFVQSFLEEISMYFNLYNFNFSPTKIQLLFGFPDLDFTHPNNHICLMLKRYIWVNKFKDCRLTISGFLRHLKKSVDDLKYIFELKNEDKKYIPWLLLENALAL